MDKRARTLSVTPLRCDVNDSRLVRQRGVDRSFQALDESRSFFTPPLANKSAVEPNAEELPLKTSGAVWFGAKLPTISRAAPPEVLPEVPPEVPPEIPPEIPPLVGQPDERRALWLMWAKAVAFLALFAVHLYLGMSQ